MRHPPVNLLHRRRAGVLLHVTSLPSRFDCGVLGPEARQFVDFLCEGDFSIWQTLPVGPVDNRTLSPYSLRSANAGNPRLIDLDLLSSKPWHASQADLDSARLWADRSQLIERTWNRFCQLASAEDRRRFLGFARNEHAWLQPFALYEALKSRYGQSPWWKWPEPVRVCDRGAIHKARREEKHRIRRTIFEQFLFAEQWQALKRYANERGVYLFGDIPLYIDMDSTEVWWRRDLFQVDSHGRATVVSGVPPDYFAEEGQLWGHPIYDWDRMRSHGYRWFVDRIRYQLTRFDLLRIDHFRGLDSYWEIPGDATSAREGRWAPGPGAGLLDTLARESMTGALVAEDLGIITPSVRTLRDQFHLPGLLVLQFAFDGSDDNPFLPENHATHAVVYTGTHDNDTTEGWSRSLPAAVRAQVRHRLRIGTGPIVEAMIEAAWTSPAQLAMFPMQDLLGLGTEHRMNTPGTTDGNWRWRFRWSDVPDALPAHCRALARRSSRSLIR